MVEKFGLLKRYKEAAKLAYHLPCYRNHGYVFINLSRKIRREFAVSINFLGEDKNTPFPQFFI